MPGSVGESMSGTARPPRIGVAPEPFVVRERDLDRPRAAVVGDAEASDLVHLGLREAHRREDRVLARAHDRDRRVGSGLLAGELEDAHDARVVGALERGAIERGGAGDRGGDASRERLVECVAQRLRELGEAVVVPLEHRGHDFLLPRRACAEREDEEREAGRAEYERRRVQGDRDESSAASAPITSARVGRHRLAQLDVAEGPSDMDRALRSTPV